MIKQLFCLIVFMMLFSALFANSICILDTGTTVAKTDIAKICDAMTTQKFYNSKNFTIEKNKYNYPSNYRPTYSDSVIINRVKILDDVSPFEYKYNADVRRWIDFYISKTNLIGRLVGLSQLYYPMFEEQLDRYGVPLEMKHLAIVESALNPKAKSHAGAAGLWQFMYKTGILYDLNVTSYVDDRCDPYKASNAAARHLVDLYEIYHDWALVLAAYNAGPGTINRAIKRSGGEYNYWKIKHFLPRETQQYVPAFIGASYAMAYYAEHNINVMKPKFADYEIDTVSVKEKTSFSFLSKMIGVPMDELEFLNPQYIKDIIPSTENNIYKIRLPRKYILTFVEKEKAMYDSIHNYDKKMDSLQNVNNPVVSKKNETVETTPSREKETPTYVAPTRGDKIYHTVSKGETLGTIANKYNTSVSNIKSWNSISSSMIYSGQRLVIYGKKAASSTNNKSTSSSESAYYTVRKGDSLWGVAQKNGTTVENVKKLNNMKSESIQIGQKLRVR